MMSFPAASVNIAPVSFLKYTTYSSNTVVSPMMTKTIGGTERRATVMRIIDTVEKHTFNMAHIYCHLSSSRDREFAYTILLHTAPLLHMGPMD